MKKDKSATPLKALLKSHLAPSCDGYWSLHPSGYKQYVQTTVLFNNDAADIYIDQIEVDINKNKEDSSPKTVELLIWQVA